MLRSGSSGCFWFAWKCETRGNVLDFIPARVDNLLQGHSEAEMLACGMQDSDRRTLRRNSANLLKQLVVDAMLLQSLQANDVLTEGMAESIRAESTNQDRCWKLLLLLPKRGPRAFSCFLTALRDSEQQHLCDLLEGPHTEGTDTHTQSVEAEEEREREGELTETSREASRVESCGSSSVQDSEPSVRNRERAESSGAEEEADDMRTSENIHPIIPPPTDGGRERLLKTSPPLSTQEETAAKRARTHEFMELSLDADSPLSSPVLATSSDFYLSHCQQSYRMTSSPRGLGLVICNVTFDPLSAPELEPRKGGEVDEEVLRRVLTELDYVVTLRRDLTAQEMRSCIETFCRRADHQASDSCVVSLLSHGVDGAVYGTDGQLLQLDWVFEAFDNVHCPLLQNKPKMFFIQACRGDEMDCGVEQVDGPPRTTSPGCEQRDAGREGRGDGDAILRGNLGRPRIKLPHRSDMICGYASLKGTAAMRNTKRGSWFIQELNAALRLRARDTHLADILVQVNGRIKQREGFAPGTAHHRCKEMSEFTSSLCKDLHLFPKYQPDHY